MRRSTSRAWCLGRSSPAGGENRGVDLPQALPVGRVQVTKPQTSGVSRKPSPPTRRAAISKKEAEKESEGAAVNANSSTGQSPGRRGSRSADVPRLDSGHRLALTSATLTRTLLVPRDAGVSPRGCASTATAAAVVTTATRRAGCLRCLLRPHRCGQRGPHSLHQR